MRFTVLFSSILLANYSLAELVMLDDSGMSDVVAQDGITIETEQTNSTINNIEYRDDNNGFNLSNISIRDKDNINNAFTTITTIDVNENGELQLGSSQTNGMMTIGSLSFTGDANNLGGLSSSFDTRSSVLRLRSGGRNGSGLSGSLTSTSTGGQLSWITGAHSLDLEAIGTQDTGIGTFTIDIESKVDPVSSQNLAWLVVDLDNVSLDTHADYKIGANSLGQLKTELTSNYFLELTGGGAIGAEGMKFNIDADSSGDINISSINNGRGVWLEGFSNELHIRNGTLDVLGASDTYDGQNLGRSILITMGEMWSDLSIDKMTWGAKSDSGNSNTRSMGSLELQLYAKDSYLAVSSTQMTGQCWFGAGANSGACGTNGGLWVDPQGSGVSIFTKLRLSTDVTNLEGDAVTNRLAWITNKRDVAGEQKGTEFVFNGLTTNDGTGDKTVNDFGLQTKLDLHVGATRTSTGAASGIIMKNEVQFKELRVDSIDLVHPTGGVEQDHGLVMQNFHIKSNMTITPIL